MNSDKSSTPHILLVGKSRKKHVAAHGLGYRLSAVMTISQFKTTDTSFYERAVAVSDDATTMEWVAAAKHISQFVEFNALGVFSEPLEHIGIEIGHSLNLPYLPKSQIEFAKDKYLMRSKLKEFGIENTYSRMLDFPFDEAIRQVLLFQKGAIIVKPYDGVSSRGVSLVQSEDDIPEAIDWALASGIDSGLVAETYLQGPEYSIEMISHNGFHQLVAVTEKIKDEIHFVELGHTIPANISIKVREKLSKHVELILCAIGHITGPSHTEVILTEDGARLVEIHFRIGGDDIDLLCELTTGLDMNKVWVQQLLNEYNCNGLKYIEHEGVAGVRFSVASDTGVLTGVTGIDLARSIPGVHSIKQLISDGEIVSKLRDSTSRVLSVIAHAPDRSKLERIFKKVDSLIDIRFENVQNK